MATSTSTGISILRNRERNIPDVDVLMLPTAAMLNGTSYCGKDLMVQIWGAEKKIVYGIQNQESQNTSRGTAISPQLSDPSNPSQGLGYKVYGVSKTSGVLTDNGGYELPSLVYLANAMILDPYMLPVNTYLTKKTTYKITSSDLDTYGQKVVVHGSAEDHDPGSIFTYDSAVDSTNTSDVGAVSFQGEPDNLTTGVYQESTKKSSNNPDNLHSPKAITRVQTQPPSGNATKTQFFTAILSTFKLKKNQPFGIGMTMFSPSESWLEKLSTQEAELFGTGDTQGLVDSIYAIPSALRKNTVTFIEFGGGEGDQLMLVVYQQRGKIELYKLGTQLVQTNSQNQQSSGGVQGMNQMGGQNQQQSGTATVKTRVKLGERNIKASADSDSSNYQKLNLAIYPIGNQLVVSDGEDGLRMGVKAARHDSVAIFNNESVLNITEGPIRITTYLGSATYSYSHVLHVPQGIFASPEVNIRASGSNGSPIMFVDFEGRVGAGQAQGETEFHLPIGNDTFYDFLSETVLKAETSSTNGNLKYKLTLTSNSNDGGDQLKRIYSPRVYSVQARVRPQTLRVQMNPVQIDKKDIIRVEVNMTVLGSGATVTLNNRNLADCPPHTGGKYNLAAFNGVKPIQISYGVVGETRTEVRFTGYVIGRSFGLGAKGTKSDITLRCEDVSIKAKNSYAVNLPIFDGWCHLAAFYYLAREAGYDDDEIVYNRSGDIKLSTIIAQGGGDTENMIGGCFSGHEGQVFRGQVIHAPLPMPNNKTSPFYMFPMGTTIWDCMMEIRKFGGFYLFANHKGQLVYAPPENVFTTNIAGVSTGFIEQGGQEINNNKRFTEIQGQLNVEHKPLNSKNTVLVVGYDTNGLDSTIPIGEPIFQVSKDSRWPFNTTSQNYIPWQATTILRNPMWNDAARTAFIAQETFKRINRPYTFVTWNSFGQVGILPYDQIEINESLSNETGVDGKDIIVNSITDKLDANSMSFFSSYQGEIVDIPTLNSTTYDPHLHGYVVSG